MNKIEIRPKYEFTVDYTPEEALGRIREKLKSGDANITGKIVGRFSVIGIPKSNQHFWSPELSAEMVAEAEGGTLVKCMLGPTPSVWTLFMSFYVFAVFVGIAGLVLGGSQWLAGTSKWGLWLIPVSIIMIKGAYVIALSGQKFAREQMLVLREFLNSALGVS